MTFIVWGAVILGVLALGSISAILFLAIFPAAVWVVLIANFKQTWRASLLPVTSIRGASQGPVKLQGHLDGESLVSPFTNTPCKVWRAEVYYQYKGGGQSQKYADTYASSHEFVTLNDGTGLCILPFEANWEIAKKTTKKLDTIKAIDALPESGRSMIAEQMLKRPGLSQTDTRWIVSEYRIDNDDTVYAQGVFKSVRGNETPFDDGDLQRIERKGAAASKFSQWAIKDIGEDLRSDQNAYRDAWRRYARKMLGLDGVAGKSALPSDQTINTLTEHLVDIVDGEPGQYYFPFSATNISLAKTKRKETRDQLLLFVIATALTVFVVYLYDPTLIRRLVGLA